MDDGLHRFICPKCYVNATSGTWDTATARRYNVGIKDIESILKGYKDFFAQFVCPSCGNTVSGDQLMKRSRGKGKPFPSFFYLKNRPATSSCCKSK